MHGSQRARATNAFHACDDAPAPRQQRPRRRTARIPLTHTQQHTGTLTRGSLVYTASTSVNMKYQSAPTTAATCAPRLSLSPNISSCTATVSFSFTMGITPRRSSSPRVLRAFRYWFRSPKHSYVSSTCERGEGGTRPWATPYHYNSHREFFAPHLRARVPHLREELVVNTHERTLSNRRQRLLRHDGRRARRQLHAHTAKSHGTRGDDDHRVAALP